VVEGELPGFHGYQDLCGPRRVGVGPSPGGKPRQASSATNPSRGAMALPGSLLYVPRDRGPVGEPESPGATGGAQTICATEPKQQLSDDLGSSGKTVAAAWRRK
jgi:hypothetical protein